MIASLIAAHPAHEHLIMSTDKDFYQLLSPRVSVLNTQRRADRRRIRPTEVYDKHRVLPHQWCDYRALTGDKSDNIPGIGDKTAARLLVDGAHLEDLGKLDRLTGRIGYLIRDQWDQLILWRTLIQLRTDFPLPTTIGTHQPSSLPSAPDVIVALDLWKWRIASFRVALRGSPNVVPSFNKGNYSCSAFCLSFDSPYWILELVAVTCQVVGGSTDRYPDAPCPQGQPHSILSVSFWKARPR